MTLQKDKRARAKANAHEAGEETSNARSKLKGRTPKVFNANDSGHESDGNSALRRVEEAEQSQKNTGHRGPQNQSMIHYHDPVPTKDKSTGKLRWLFSCKFCNSHVRSVRTVDRTVKGKDPKWEDEPKLPKMNNLVSHLKECKVKNSPEDSIDSGDEGTSINSKFNLKRSADMIGEYIKEGEKNPQVILTQKGFLHLFSAWILDESLPWTTGESPSLAALFKYLKITFNLPSDTTVHNQLAHIFHDLHTKVVHEFSEVKSRISYSADTWTTPQMVYSFACSIAHCIDDDWNLIERVVDFLQLEDKEHEGFYAVLDGSPLAIYKHVHYAAWVLSELLKDVCPPNHEPYGSNA
ncbi:unnamed protein product [Cyclocybe aegerita]|uniref:Transposase n=1 Tax=Cyclocybe aegerita TaxID=1973307 RepID=A0A8S0VW20_CYCAE|nr:unnamed protein product [Cyclocybe aegerita]